MLSNNCQYGNDKFAETSCLSVVSVQLALTHVASDNFIETGQSGLNASGGFCSQPGGRRSAVTFSLKLAATTAFRIVRPRFQRDGDIPDGHAESEQRHNLTWGPLLS